MKIFQKIRKAWHDSFYYKASPRRLDFALKCKNVTERIDLKLSQKSLTDRFRLALHLSLCQACNNYYHISRVLSEAIKNSPPPSKQALDQMNKKLLEKYSRIRSNDSKHKG